MISTSEYSAIALEHARHPHNLGPLVSYNGYACITGPCGDTMEFWLLVEEGIVKGVSFRTDGCGSSSACGSMATVLASNLPVKEAQHIRQPQILNALGGFPEDAQHCALLASNTLRKACYTYLEKDRPPRPVGRMMAYLKRMLIKQ